MDSFFGIGIFELFFIAIIALIVLGPERLPGAVREVGKHLRTLRNLSSELSSQFGEELQALDEINPKKILAEMMEEPEEEKTAKGSAGSRPPKSPNTTAKTTATAGATRSAASTSKKPATTPAQSNRVARPTETSDSSAGATSATPAEAEPSKPSEVENTEVQVTGENRILSPQPAESAEPGEDGQAIPDKTTAADDKQETTSASMAVNGTKSKAEDEA